MPRVSPEKKIRILVPIFMQRVKAHQQLIQQEKHYTPYIKQYVKELPDLNLRTLITNLDSLITHFLKKHRGEQGDTFMLPPHERNGNMEDFPAFLRRLKREYNRNDQSEDDDEIGEADIHERADDEYDSASHASGTSQDEFFYIS